MSKSEREAIENESDGSSEADLEKYSKANQFPHNKLQELVYNDRKFTTTIVSYIRKANKKMKKEEHRHAIASLSEAEKILQYGASCGKVIDRRLILCTLHNEACCFQKMNDKLKATKYIEAILYNLKEHLHSLQGTPTTSNILESAMMKATSEGSQITYARKLELARYYLQFCSLNSQLQYRKEALEAGKAAVELYKWFFTEIKIEYRSIEEFDYPSLEDKAKITKSFKNFKIFRDTVNLSHIELYLKICRQVLKKCTLQNKKAQKSLLDNFFSEYSIGNLVQMDPMEYEELESCGNLFQGKKLVESLVHCAMGYFQIATEYRLLSEERYKIDEIERMNSDQFRYSNIYHLLAITFLCLYVPFDLLFMNQIVQSYKFHYKMDLIKDATLQSSPLDLTVLFSLDTSRDKKSTTSNKKFTLQKKLKKSCEKSNLRKLSKNKLSKSKIKQPSHLSSRISGSASKNEYFSNASNNDQVKQESTRKRLNSNASKKSNANINSNTYYLGQSRPITSHQALHKPITTNIRVGRVLSSSYGKVSNDVHSKLKNSMEMDEYGTSNKMKIKNSILSKSKRSSRNNSIDSNGYMLKKVASQASNCKISHKELKKEKEKEHLPITSPKSKNLKKSVHQTKSKGTKSKKTISNYYL